MLRTLLFLLTALPLAAQSPLTLSGTVTDATSGEQLAGVNVYLPATTTGAQTNVYGFYSLTLSEGAAAANRVVFSYLGYRNDTLRLPAAGERLDVALVPTNQQLSTVEVSAQAGAAARAGAGVHHLDRQAIIDNPVLLGEKDALKALQLLPGVANPREGFGGLFVRGGSPGQNLILLDGAPVYNAFHLFGFLSVFDADALQRVTLYKGQFPARFGGRVSSVVDLRMKEGNRKAWHGRGGIGLLTSRLTLEGPIGNNEKISVLLSGRRTYLDAIYNVLSGEDDKLYFYDGNFKLNYHLDERQQLFISGYLGQDRFSFRNTYGGTEQTDGFDWGNRTLTVRYNRELGDRAFLNVTAIRSSFDFTVENEEVTRGQLYRVTYRSGIRDLGLQTDLDYFLSSRHTLRAGLSVTDHDFDLTTSAERSGSGGGGPGGGHRTRPGTHGLPRRRVRYLPPPDGQLRAALHLLRPPGRAAQLRRRRAPAESELPTAGGLDGHRRLRLHPAVPASVVELRSEPTHQPLGTGLGVGTPAGQPADFGGHRLESPPRHPLGPDRGGVRAPLCRHHRLHQRGQLLSARCAQRARSGQSHRRAGQPDHRQRPCRRAGAGGYVHYGAVAHFPGLYPGGGRRAADGGQRRGLLSRRHDLTLTARYALRPNLLVSANWTYGSGVPTTIPITRYALGNASLPGFVNGINLQGDFKQRHNYRMAAVHRLDVALRWRRSPRWGTVIWELGLYNAYSRANPFYVSTIRGRDGYHLIQHALFPVVPSLSFNFEF